MGWSVHVFLYVLESSLCAVYLQIRRLTAASPETAFRSNFVPTNFQVPPIYETFVPAWIVNNTTCNQFAVIFSVLRRHPHDLHKLELHYTCPDIKEFYTCSLPKDPFEMFTRLRCSILT